MAANADSVVVEVLAKVDQFDQPIKQSAARFDASMKQVAGSAEQAEKIVTTAHGKMALAANNNRIGLLELQHVVRGSVDQFASGAPASQIFAQHIASVGEAAALSGGSLGKFGAVMSGPWGLAISAGVAILATFISKMHDSGDATETAVEKLKKHHDQTLANDEAQRIYNHTVEGSIEAMNKLTAEIDKQNLTLEDNIALKKAAIAGSIADVVGNIGTVSTQLAQAIAQAREARRLVEDIQSGKLVIADDPGPALLAAQSRAADANKQVSDLTAKLFGLSAAAEGGAKALGMVDFPLIDRNAKSAADPIAKINQLYDDMANNAKKAGTYTQALADKIEIQRAAAIKLAQVKQPDPIKQFKDAVIGAEGTGQNKLGSSASGFGQFMPSTFLSYFNRLFPDKASLTDSAKLAFRDVRTVAEAVIDKATDDYVQVIKHAGQAVTAANLYAVHLLGSRDAARLFAASSDTPTSSFLSAAVLRGNPFLRGSAGDARAAIGNRIGDSSSAVSRAAVEIQREITSEAEKQEKALNAALTAEAKVTVEKEGQARIYNVIDQYLQQHLKHTIDAAAAEDALRKHLEIVAAQMKEVTDFGGVLIDEVLNPDNWSHWGDTAKHVLKEIELEILKLAAINPLKNLLNGNNALPTLGGIFGKLLGGFDAAGFSAIESSNAAALGLPGNFFGGPHLAGGGSFKVNGSPGDTNTLSINGVRRAMVAGDETIAVIPNGTVSPSNATAMPASSGIPTGHVLVRIEPSPYFDGRVVEVTNPRIAQASVAAANGGAAIGRRNLGREQMHRLD